MNNNQTISKAQMDEWVQKLIYDLGIKKFIKTFKTEVDKIVDKFVTTFDIDEKQFKQKLCTRIVMRASRDYPGHIVDSILVNIYDVIHTWLVSGLKGDPIGRIYNKIIEHATMSYEIAVETFNKDYKSTTEYQRFMYSINVYLSALETVKIEYYSMYDTNQQLTAQKSDKTKKSAVFGKYAFPGERRTLPIHIEKHTEIEQKTLRDLDQHFHNSAGISDEVAKTLKTLKKNKLYDDIIKTPTEGIIYRGMGFDIHNFAKFMTKKQFIEFAKSKFVNLFIEKSMIYKPRRNSSSWSTDRDVSLQFAADNSLGLQVILYADIEQNKNNLFAADDGLYDLEILNSVSNENEIMAIGNVKVHKIEIRKDNYFKSEFEEWFSSVTT